MPPLVLNAPENYSSFFAITEIIPKTLSFREREGELRITHLKTD